MRPLFAIVPVVALLAWLGEPQAVDPATAADAASAATAATTGQHRIVLNSPSLGTSLISARTPLPTGTPHLMSTRWTPSR